MKLEKKYSVTAFLDILGYKELILNNSNGNELDIFEDLKSTIEIALEATVDSIKLMYDHLDEKNESSERISHNLNVKQFSDNIYFSFDYEEHSDLGFYFGIYIISFISAFYQRLMLAKGYFIRGGIAHGLNMIDKNFIFSTALIKAVETEKNTVYPRITLHPELQKKFLSDIDNSFITSSPRLYVQDWSGHVFLNPYGHISRTQEIIDSLPQDEQINAEKAILETQSHIIDKLNNNFNNLLDDSEFNSMIRETIQENINKYRGNNQSVYEKYLWTYNFLNWVDKKTTELTFKYI